MTPLPTRCAILLLLAALAACQPAADKSADTQEAPDATATDVPATDPPATSTTDPLLEGSDATAVVHHAAPDPAGFDRKAFAGAFAADDVQLEIASEGTFALSDSAGTTAGTWSIDEAGKRLLLDPDTKAGTDRHYEIVSNDELRAVDAEGNPLDGAPLRRG